MNRRGPERHSRPRAQPLPDHVENLLRYYIECVREDEGQPIRAYRNDAGKRFLPWPYQSDLWYLEDTEPRITLAPDQLAFGNELTPDGTLLYGYPIYIEAGLTAIPIFTWPIEYKLHGSRELCLRGIPEWPQMNPEYLKRFARTPEEQRELLDSLGLLDVTDDPPDGLIIDILERMKDMGLLQDVVEPLEPQNLAPRPKGAGICNCAALFATERPRFTAGLVRDLEEMVRTGAPEWNSTALGTMFGEGGVREDNQTAIEIVPLNEEQRRAFQTAISSSLTVVTGPPGTGKSQIVVSLIADSYLQNRRVLFTSRNHKAVDVVEEHVARLAANPLMIRTGRRFFGGLAQRLVSLLALQPSDDDRLKYSELRERYTELQSQESDLWEELQRIRDAYDAVISSDTAQDIFGKEYTLSDWQKLQNVKGRPNSDRLRIAVQLADKYIAPPSNLLAKLSRGLSSSNDRKRIHNVGVEVVTDCPELGPCPTEDQSFQVWRTWLVQAMSTAEALDAIASYRSGLARLREMRSRDDVARQWRRVRDDLTDSGAKLVSLYARLAPDRLEPEDRQTIGNFRALLNRLDEGHMGYEDASVPRSDMIRLFRDGSRHIPAWCVTNLSARNSLPLEPNLFDLLIIDEASQCDIASALPLFYRSKRVVIIGDPFQLRHITKIEQSRDNQLQTAHGLRADELRFTYSENSLFDLSMSMGKLIQLQDHYRSHEDIAAFSNHVWYEDTLRIWTDYARLKPPPEGKYGIRWTEVSGTATRPQGGSVFILSEVNAVVEQLIDLLMNHGFDGTVEVVTPFRAQANKISERIAELLPEDVSNRAQLIIDTAHGFQGDERDIILFSPCISRDLSHGAHNFLKNTENLFNVAITRARSLLHVVGNRQACTNSEISHIQRFTEYCLELERSGMSPYRTTLRSDERIGPWERPLYDALVARGLKPLPQYPVNQYRLDMAIISGGTWIDVEADGVSTHLGSRIDAERDSRLTELGWRVVRFWNHQIRDDLDYCVETVLKAISKG